MRAMGWYIYLPGKGHRPIDYAGDDIAGARLVYLKSAGRKRLPAGAFISRS